VVEEAAEVAASPLCQQQRLLRLLRPLRRLHPKMDLNCLLGLSRSMPDFPPVRLL
jgi:hypothetical protein